MSDLGYKPHPVARRLGVRLIGTKSPPHFWAFGPASWIGKEPVTAPGMEFADMGPAMYRPGSAFARDLAALVAGEM